MFGKLLYNVAITVGVSIIITKYDALAMILIHQFISRLILVGFAFGFVFLFGFVVLLFVFDGCDLVTVSLRPGCFKQRLKQTVYSTGM